MVLNTLGPSFLNWEVSGTAHVCVDAFFLAGFGFTHSSFSLNSSDASVFVVEMRTPLGLSGLVIGFCLHPQMLPVFSGFVSIPHLLWSLVWPGALLGASSSADWSGLADIPEARSVPRPFTALLHQGF